MPRVEVRFDGVSRGARRASDDTVRGIKDVGRAADREQKRVSRFGSTIRTALGLAAKAAAGGMLALGGAVAYAGFKFNDLRSRARIAFETMLGSGAKADAMLRELQKFAATTPFEFPELIQSSQRLLAMGFTAKQIIPTMTAIGDAVAALGGSQEKLDRVTTALGQIQAKGKASAEEMLQLTEAGIPAWQFLADAIGKSVPEAMALVTKGAISADVTIAAVTTGMEARFGGMMEKQSHTFSGLLSNLKDTFTQLSGTVMAPFFEMATSGMEKLVNLTSSPSFTAGVQRFGAALGEHVAKASEMAAAFFHEHWTDVKTIIGTVWDAVKLGGRIFADLVRASDRAADAVGGWRPMLIALGAAWVAYRGFMFAAMVATRIQAAITAGTIRAALITTGIGAVVVALGFAVGLIIAHWDKVKRWIQSFGDWLSRNAGKLFFVPIVGQMLFAIGMMIRHWQTIKETVIAVWKTAADVTARFFNWLVKTALIVALKVVEPFSHLPGKLGGWARDAKVALEAQLQGMADSAARAGQATGDAWGRNYYNAAGAWMTATAQLTGQTAGAPGGATGQATAKGRGPVNIYPTGTKFSIGGAPGQGTHAAKDWQSGNAIDIFASPGTPVLSPVDGTIVKVSGRDPSLGTVAVGVKRIFGYGVTIQGFAGATYYLAHLDAVSVSAGQRVKRGQVIGKVATWKGGAAHVHVGVPWGRDPRATTLAQSASLGGTTPVADKGGGTTTAAAATTPTTGDVDYVELFGADPDNLIGPGRTTGKGATKVTPAEKARRAREAERKSVRKAAAILRDQADELAGGLSRLPARMRASIQPQMAQLRRELATVTDQRTLSRLRRDLARIQAAVKAAIARLTQEVAQRREVFGAAFGKLADKALQVFDAKTDELIRMVVAKTDDLDARLKAQTPAEAALAALRAEREATELAARRAEIEAKIASLGSAPDEETPEDKAARELDLAAARDDLRGMELDAQERALEATAALERSALEEEINLERERRERVAAEERARIEDERALQRDRFAARLEEIKTGFENEKLTAAQAQDELVALMGDYGIDFQAAGTLIGTYFAQGFRDALGDVNAAVRELTRAVNELRAATGKDPIATGDVAGEAPWERALRLRSEAMNRRYGLARGGRVPGQYVGRDDTVAASLTQGEEVLDRELSMALRRQLLGGGGFNGGGLAGATIYVLGTTDREVARALRRIVDGAPTSPSYAAPRG